MLFNFVCINYRSGNYKKELANLIKDFCSEDELLSLKMYEKSFVIIHSTEDKEVYSIIEYLSNQYFGNGYEYNIYYVFYRLNDESSQLESGYSEMSEALIIQKAKEYAELVLNKFDSYRENEDWSGFLTDISYDDFDYSNSQQNTESSGKYVTNIEKKKPFYKRILRLLRLE